MNKKGQSLIVFIIFLPIMLAALACIVDIGLMYNAKIKGERLLDEAKGEKIAIKEYFKMNKIDANVENTRKDNKSCVIIKYKIDSVFGVILGIDSYNIEVSDC